MPSPDALLEPELLVPTLDTGREPGVKILGEDSEIPFALVLDADGRPVLPAFTSEGALTRWKPQGSPYIALEGQPAREPPDGLVDALRGACEREPSIAEAYLYQFQIVKLEEPRQLTVGLRLQASSAEGEYKRLAESINGAVNLQR